MHNFARYWAIEFDGTPGAYRVESFMVFAKLAAIINNRCLSATR